MPLNIFIKQKKYKNKHIEIQMQSKTFSENIRLFPPEGIESELELSKQSPLMCLKLWKMRKCIQNSLSKAVTSQALKKHMKNTYGFIIINDTYRSSSQFLFYDPKDSEINYSATSN